MPNLKSVTFLPTALVICALLYPVFSKAESLYGTYGLYPHGSTRVLAFGGAFTGLGNSVAGIQYNPAGLVKGKWWFDLGAAENQVSNREADLYGDESKDGLNHSYQYYAAALQFKNKIAVGYSQTSPYQTHFKSSTSTGISREASLAIYSDDFAIAYALNKKLSVGVVYHMEKVEEKLNSSIDGYEVTHTMEKTYMSYGVSYWPNKKFGLGARHAPERKYLTDDAAIGLLSVDNNFNWFRGVLIPARTSGGIFFKPSKETLLAIDIDYVHRADNTVYPGSEVGSFNKVEIAAEAQQIIHGGFEWHAINSKKWELYVRGGAYNEPSRIKDGKSRQHVTWGFEGRYWFIILAFAQDRADEFLNTSAGISFTLPFEIAR